MVLSIKYVENERYLFTLLSRTFIYIVALRQTFKMAREEQTIFDKLPRLAARGWWYNARANMGRRARKSPLSSKYGPIFERSARDVINSRW